MIGDKEITVCENSDFTKMRKEQAIQYHRNKIAEIEKYGPYGRPLKCYSCGGMRFFIYREEYCYEGNQDNNGQQYYSYLSIAYCIKCHSSVYTRRLSDDYNENDKEHIKMLANEVNIAKNTRHDMHSDKTYTLGTIKNFSCQKCNSLEFFVYRDNIQYGDDSINEMVECIKCYTVTQFMDGR